MKTFKIIPQFRENCVIQGSKEWIHNLNVGDIIFLISDIPTKKFSIISKIDALESNDNPKICIDKRNLGNFGEGDEVFIVKYNPAEALEVHICISDEYSVITKGDWTANIKPSLEEKVIDIGQELTFLIPWENGAPIIGTGIVNTTLPNTPVFIGERTQIILEKLPIEALSSIKRNKLIEQELRVDILMNQINQNTIQLIREIKNKNYPNIGQKYNFKATNPKQLFRAIMDVFKGLKVIEKPFEQFFDEKKQDYLASVVYVTNNDNNSYQLIDIQITSSGYSGILVIWVTGKNNEDNLKTLQLYDSRISQLKQGLEQKVEILSVQCPECGGNLPFDKIDINGQVTCIYCNNTSKIPKVLRY